MLDLHRRAMLRSVEIVERARDDQFGAPTPCAGWTLRRLLDHMVGENHGFAAAADGERADRTPWSRVTGDDPRADYAASAHAVIASFGADGVLQREFWLPFIDDTRFFPARQAIGFHLLDYAVHAWDVAVSIGEPIVFDDDITEAVLEIAHRDVPDGPRRRRPDASFQPPVPEPDGATTQERLLAFLGREPRWRPQ
jgi:uncharacterized protein (TIGR03086 family)